MTFRRPDWVPRDRGGRRVIIPLPVAACTRLLGPLLNGRLVAKSSNSGLFAPRRLGGVEAARVGRPLHEPAVQDLPFTDTERTYCTGPSIGHNALLSNDLRLISSFSRRVERPGRA